MKISISVYLTYHQYDTIYLVLNLDQAEQNNVWLSIFQLMVKLGCDNRSKQKSYWKSDDPHWCLQEYCKLCVFFTAALTSISMSKRTPDYTHLYTQPSWISQHVQQWPPFAWVRFSQTLVSLTLLLSLPNSITIPSCLQLSAMSIIMKTTYNESFCLKVSKHELPIDGVSLGMNYVLRRDKLSHM